MGGQVAQKEVQQEGDEQADEVLQAQDLPEMQEDVLSGGLQCSLIWPLTGAAYVQTDRGQQSPRPIHRCETRTARNVRLCQYLVCPTSGWWCRRGTCAVTPGCDGMCTV